MVLDNGAIDRRTDEMTAYYEVAGFAFAVNLDGFHDFLLHLN